MAPLRRAIALEGAAAGDVDLQLDQVEAGGDLGDRVLYLQAGVDLEEGEHILLGLEEVLDGRGAAVAGGADQVGGDGTQVVGLLLAHHRRGGFLDDLLVLALDRAVAHAGRPHVAVRVRDDLDLDVAGLGDKTLEEDDGVTERALGFTLGALERELEFVLGEDLADAATAAAAAGLDDERVADGLGVPARVGAGVDGAARPRGDGDADLLGEQLGLDLVTEQSHGVRGGADERDAELSAQFREARVLGDEAPADPHRVGLGRDERTLEHAVVQVCRPGGGLVQHDGLVGLSHEQCATLGFGVQRYRADVVVVLGVQLAYSLDQAYCRLAAVDYRDPFEHQLFAVLDGVWMCSVLLILWQRR